jgi:hypothetical protein
MAPCSLLLRSLLLRCFTTLLTAALLYSGSTLLRLYFTMALLYYGSTLLRLYFTMALLYYGSTLLWLYFTMALLYYGSTLLWRTLSEVDPPLLRRRLASGHGHDQRDHAWSE